MYSHQSGIVALGPITAEGLLRYPRARRIGIVGHLGGSYKGVRDTDT